MDNNRVDMFIMSHQKYLPADKMIYVREKLNSLDENRFNLLSTIEFKDPTIALVLSLFLGGLGIDRFYIGDTGIGVLKLLTGGCCGILAIIDWFLIMKRTREKNFEELSVKIL
ncbi:MAG TPA: TM2 domain-containing protein [Clostridiales bacterium]|nr:TM2 domain-containing protein [Clostridiales bacterium]